MKGGGGVKLTPLPPQKKLPSKSPAFPGLSEKMKCFMSYCSKIKRLVNFSLNMFIFFS